MKEVNFYELLEISPKASLKDIEKAYKEKRAHWSRLISRPDNEEILLKIKQLEGIDKFLTDRNYRQEQKNQAIEREKRRKYEEEKERNASLNETIHLYSKKGWISKAEAKSMQKIFSLSLSEIKEHIPVKIKETSSINEDKNLFANLDTSDAREISNICKRLGVESLEQREILTIYDYLLLSTKTSNQTLINEIQKKERNVRKKRNDTMKNDELNLIARARRILRNPEAKENYDRALIKLRLEPIEQSLAIVKETKEMYESVYQEFIRHAMSRGNIGEKKAKNYIDGFLQLHRISIIKDDEGQLEQNFVQCSLCGFINLEEFIFCSNCRTELFITCPSCQVKTQARSRVCGNCSASLTKLININNYLEAARTYYNREQYKESKQLLHSIIDWWPNHKKAQELLTEIDQIIRQKDETIKRIYSLIDQRKYYTAKRLVIQSESLMKRSEGFQSLKEEINESIHLANECLLIARRLDHQQKKEEKYFQALTYASDCEEAKSQLKLISPLPSSSIDVNSKADCFIINWEKSSSKGQVRYSLLKKVGSPSVNIKDGELIYEGPACQYVDRDLKEGFPYYYTIFTRRQSRLASNFVSKGPCLYAADIYNVRVLQERNNLRFTWENPQNIHSIEIWRKKGGIPYDRGDGILLKKLRSDEYVDRQVLAGTYFGYRFIAVYKEKEKNYYSKGFTALSYIHKQSNIISSLQIKQEENEYKLTWEEESNPFTIYYGSWQPDFVKGEQISLKTWQRDYGNRYESLYVEAGEKEKRIQTNLKAPVYFLPVMKEEDFLLIGKEVVLQDFPKVSDLRLHEVAEREEYFLLWKWPRTLQEVVILKRTDQYPKSADDPKATIKTYTKQEYITSNGYPLGKLDSRYFLTVYGRYKQSDGSVFLSEGEKCLVGLSLRSRLIYEFKRKLFSNNIELQFFNDEIINIPSLIVVQNQEGVPVTREEGKVIYEINAQTLQRRASFTIPTNENLKNSYARIFTKEDHEANLLELAAKLGAESMKL